MSTSIESADPAYEPAGQRRAGVLLANRGPDEVPVAAAVPWPETALGVVAAG